MLVACNPLHLLSAHLLSVQEPVLAFDEERYGSVGRPSPESNSIMADRLRRSRGLGGKGNGTV